MSRSLLRLLIMYESLLADIVAGRSAEVSDLSICDFLNSCEVHGLNALVYRESQIRDLALPKEVLEPLKEKFDAHKLFEMLHLDQLHQVFAAFSEHHLDFLVLKGTALAYQVYQPAFVRSRGDTDLLIRDRDRESVDRILRELDFKKTANSSVEHLSYQQSFEHQDELGFLHSIDLHWRLNNRKAFSDCFSFDEMFADSRALGQLSGCARSLSVAHEFLHLCMHRVGHISSPEFAGELTAEGDRLLWLYDICLLSRQLSDDDWRFVCELAQRHGFCRAVMHTLTSVDRYFSAGRPEFVARELQPVHFEASSLLLRPSRVAGFVADVLALSGWPRLIFIKETLLPQPQYMLTKYQKRSRFWLPILYLRRLIGF